MEKNNKIISKTVSGALLCTMVAYTSPILAYTKDETVYSKLNSNGNSYNTIVSTRLKNSESSTLINDLSNLLNIKNTNGDETFTQDGNSILWNSNGSDIYYQGESQESLPIECKITYTLDGKEISAEDLAGKSGKVTITLEYTNKDEHIVKVNGKSTKLYTPFVVVAGTIINNNTNKNITITNGKAIDDGSKTVVAGIALPGLQESLGVSKNTIDIPNSITIEMDATDFELNSIASFVTPKVLDTQDIDNFDKLDEIFSKIDTLQSSSTQLVQGTTDLNNGIKQLSEGVDELTNTSSTTVSAIGKAAVSAANLSNTQKTAIANQAANAANLSDTQKQAIAAQAQNAANLSDAQKQAIAAQAQKSAILTDAQKKAIANEAEAGAVLTTAQQEKIKAEAAANAKKELTTEKLAAIASNAAKLAQQSNTYKSIENNTQLDTNTKTQMLSLIIGTAKETAQSTAQATAIETAQKTAIVTAQEIATTVAKQTAVTVAEQIAKQVASQTAMQVAQNTAKQVAGQTATQVAQNTATQVAGQTATTVAQSTATSVAKQTATTVAQSTATTVAKQTAVSTANGVGETLSSNIDLIAQGSNTLAQGMETFDKEGIQTICSYINGDLKDVSARVEKLADLSKEYSNFTMLNNGAEGNVKFIMIVDAIKKDSEEESQKDKAILNETEKSDKTEE